MNNLVYNGLQQRPNGKPMPTYTDMVSRSTFMVDTDAGQTVEGQLAAMRKRFLPVDPASGAGEMVQPNPTTNTDQSPTQYPHAAHPNSAPLAGPMDPMPCSYEQANH